MKKRRGRPPKDLLPPLQELPSWAIKRIQELSKKSGVTPSRIRDHALKLGLYTVAEQYTSLIESLASADTLFSSSETIERDRQDPRSDIETTIDELHQLAADREVAEMPEPETEGADQNGSDYVAIGGGFGPPVVKAD